MATTETQPVVTPGDKERWSSSEEVRSREKLEKVTTAKYSAKSIRRIDNNRNYKIEKRKNKWKKNGYIDILEDELMKPIKLE